MYGELYHRVYHAPDAHHHAHLDDWRRLTIKYMVLCHNVLRFLSGRQRGDFQGRRGITFQLQLSARFG
jgi:hypothetical protein